MIYLFIVPFFPTVSCHVGSYLYDQIKAIDAQGRYEVVIIKPVASNAEKDYAFGGLKVNCFKEINLPSNAWPGLFDCVNIKALDSCLRRLGIKYSDIAVAHAHVTRTGIYANHIKKKNPNVTAVLQHHGYDVLQLTDGYFAKFKWHKQKVLNYGAKICNEIDLHVGVSQKTLNVLRSYNNVMVKNSYVLYNGVNLSKFHPLEKHKNKVFAIGCVANFWPLKDHITLIRAVETIVNSGVSNIIAFLVGEGETLQACKDYVCFHQLDQYIKFVKPMPHNEMCVFYNQLDLFVLPSYWDSMGCVYLEAHACGAPFVTAEGTGIVELIPEEDRNNWVIRPHDAERLAQIIKDFMLSPHSQRLTIDYDINSLVKKYLDFLQI